MTDTREATPRPAMEARERLAKAIYESRNGKGCKPFHLHSLAYRRSYLDDADAAIAAFHLTDAAALALMDDEGMVAPKWLTLGQHDAAKHLNDRVKFYQAAIAASPYKENPND